MITQLVNFEIKFSEYREDTIVATIKNSQDTF